MSTADSVEGATGRAVASEEIVLETKLTPPRVRAEHLSRRHLLAGLRAGDSRKLTLVAAPPGFGKSTLLAEWAASPDGPTVAWLTLDENDNDPARFFTYVAAALRRTEPGLGERGLTALRSPGADLIQVVLPLFLNDLAGLGRDVVLVIEDYHVIRNPDVHRALAYLIERSPSVLRVVLSTREDPPLPLGRLRARGDLAEVRAGDLRFTDAETASFLNEALGLALSPSDVARLQERAEGWPAALYLAALSLRGRHDPSQVIDRYAGDDRYLVDYLTTEVLARQTPELRSFLLRTSILRRFSGSLCDAVTERDDSAARLVELERSNLLLVPLDTRREWYRYHHLFGDLLLHELEATSRAVIPELHRRASAWYRDAGLIVDAADHAIAAGDVAAVAELVSRHYAVFVDQGQLQTVIGWLEAIPEPIAAKDWLLGFAGALVCAHAGRFDEAERWLRLAEQAPPVVRNGQEPAGPLAAVAGYLRLLRGDLGESVTLTRRALAAGTSADPIRALAPQMVLAPGLWWTGEPGEARAIHEAIARTAQAAGITAALVYSLGNRAAIALDEQDEAAAASLADQAIALMAASALQDHPWAGIAHIVHGALLGRRGELQAASTAIEHGVALGERLRAWQLIAYGWLSLAEVRHRQHEPTAARRLLARVRDVLESLPDPGDGLARLERTEKVLRLRPTRVRDTAAAAFWELSQRELEVLRFLPSRLSQREIAAELFVSFNTIRTHTRVVFGKLGVTSRAEAVARARELGLL
ncbi:MAG TPA: LuxR C-terminal-related transcriptional regulator [Candidatus Limnocylindrales bacterium]|nr:LuxR C-terminal-related transcriptional regulator [Candidatus Limnocylindrales bacterium]